MVKSMIWLATLYRVLFKFFFNSSVLMPGRLFCSNARFSSIFIVEPNNCRRHWGPERQSGLSSAFIGFGFLAGGLSKVTVIIAHTKCGGKMFFRWKSPSEPNFSLYFLFGSTTCYLFICFRGTRILIRAFLVILALSNEFAVLR